MAKAKPKQRAGAHYLRASRSLAASYVLVMPLFALYQVGLVFDPSVRNGTAPIFREFLHRFSHLGLVVVNLVPLGLLCLAIWRTRSRRRDRTGLYGLMVLEACAWTALMVLVAKFVVPHLLELPRMLALSPTAQKAFAFIGAGIYEEVLFRLLLMGGLVLVFQRGLGGHPGWVVPLAVVASSVVFSWAHHALGGEPYDRDVFLYRAVMGGVLGTIFWFRGLGIVVYVHALYNMSLLPWLPTPSP